jgi:hypothetical protein
MDWKYIPYEVVLTQYGITLKQSGQAVSIVAACLLSGQALRAGELEELARDLGVTIEGRRTAANLRTSIVGHVFRDSPDLIATAMSERSLAGKVKDPALMSDLVDELILQDPDHRGEVKDLTGALYLKQNQGRADERAQAMANAAEKLGMKKPKGQGQGKGKGQGKGNCKTKDIQEHKKKQTCLEK